MALKYPIYVRSISNLSDARYCAGMGVEMLGFCFDESDSAFVDQVFYQGISSWLSGVQFVGEFLEVPSEKDINGLAIDFVMTSQEYSITHPDLAQPIIYAIDMCEIPEILPPAGTYILLLSQSNTDSCELYDDFIKNVAKDHKVFLGFGFDFSNIHQIYSLYKPYGFSLKGGIELSPGLKSYEDLAEILEAIEID